MPYRHEISCVALGAIGAFGLITACMVGVMGMIGVFGPSSRDLEADDDH